MTDNIKYALIVIVLIVAGVFAFEWVQEHDARIKAEAETKVQQAKIETAQQAIDDREKVYEKSIKDYADVLRSVKTPEQAIKSYEQAPEKLINVPTPVVEYKTIADAPKVGDLVVPKADILPIFQQLNECKIAQAGISKCDLDKKDLITQRDAFKAQADEWQKAAKGGSKLHRTLSTLEKVGAGVVVGYGLRVATHR